MAVKLDEIRKAAERVAGSLGLDVVDVEFTGAAKSRTLCVYLEKNAAGRAAQEKIAVQQIADMAANPESNIPAEELVAVPEKFARGGLDPEHLSWLTHEDCAAFSRDFGTLRREDFKRFKGSLVKLQTFEPITNNRHWQGRLTECNAAGITLDLTATKQNSKSRKTGVSTVEIAFVNIEKAHLVPEF
jgi:ribosome maturation factor RimP